MEKNGRTIVVSAFIKKDDKYLIVYDPKFRFWRVPGGRLEQGESEEETLKREMFEELNIGIVVRKFLGSGKDDVNIYGVSGKLRSSRLIRYYECEILSGDIVVKEKKEVSEFKWVTLDEMRKIVNLEPALKDFWSVNN